MPQQEQSLSRPNHPAGRPETTGPDQVAAGALCRINPRGHCAVARSTRKDRPGTRAREIPSLPRTPLLRARGPGRSWGVVSLPHLAAPSSSAWLPLHPKGTNQWAVAAAAAGGGGGAGRREPGNLEGGGVVGEEERWRLAPDKSEGDCCGGSGRRDHFLEFLGCDHEVVSEREERQ
ncbi:hypothetical protein PAHAL_9G178600 [Panicum hallii]|uniref:Uncharacterized protein n=1 Tax=Panicum hallii TaxID=206008 RepID=A0A2T8I1K1_9POAL|nr:hypothetical protein PAHAL_9G178600 [Panicum hallii]